MSKNTAVAAGYYTCRLTYTQEKQERQYFKVRKEKKNEDRVDRFISRMQRIALLPFFQ